ncbi:hypothetical protein ACOZ32_00495 [Halobacterium sp. MBLA0001]|uniref:hypothetical protein n=1 Tax=Halobacterium sp. MBLA0001 TaxID=3413511 RepID=UPI003C77404E
MEFGLFGYDPYIRTLPELHGFINFTSLSEYINDGASWPLFYSLVSIGWEVSGTEIDVFSKYIPMISITLPSLYYLFLRRLYNWRIAGAAATGFASVRTLLMFETKFVDELHAVILVFICLLAVSMGTKKWTHKIQLIITTIAISLSHHLTAVIAALFFTTKLISGQAAEYIPTFRNETADNDLIPSLILYLMVTTIFVYFAQDFVLRFGVKVLRFLNGESIASAPAGGVSGLQHVEGLNLLAYISRLSILVLAIMALLHIYLFFSHHENSDYELTLIFFSGIISSIYLGLLVVGTIIPVDPIRFLIFLSATILPPALMAIFKLTESHTLESVSTILASFLICLFILTQISAIPPHVMQSDVETTVIGQGHYSNAQFQSSEWASKYHNGRIAGYEWGLWAAEENEFIDPIYVDNDDCGSTVLVWRNDSHINDSSLSSPIYTTGELDLINCENSLASKDRIISP